MPIPKIYIIKDNTPNAFTTSRNPQNATVAVTEGLLNLLTIQEIKGVIAHELSHVKHYDILTNSIAAIIAGAIALLANFAQFGMLSSNKNNRPNAILTIITVLIMPIVATIIQMAISRQSEYEADKGAAMIKRAITFSKHIKKARKLRAK
ncbi:MAG: M48 family metalloprotease [Campylobacter sp.]